MGKRQCVMDYIESIYVGEYAEVYVYIKVCLCLHICV